MFTNVLAWPEDLKRVSFSFQIGADFWYFVMH